MEGKMEGENVVFVTVGTTSFDQLIETASNEKFIELLKRKGYQSLVLQIGRGVSEPQSLQRDDFSMQHYRYKDSIAADIQRASLVISHAGAGSVLEVLHAGKPLIVVINELLMDNHQLELASQLSEEGHLYYATCRTLLETVKERDLSLLNPYSSGKPDRFSLCMDKVMGFCS